MKRDVIHILSEMDKRRAAHEPLFVVPDKYEASPVPEKESPRHPVCGHPLNGDFTYMKSRQMVRKETHIGYHLATNAVKCRHCTPENERIRRLHQGKKDLTALFSDAGIPDYGKGWSFANFPEYLDYETAGIVALLTEESLDLIKRGETGISIFLHGKTGSGKTSIAIGSMRKYMEEGYDCAFLAIRNCIDLIYQGWRKDASDEMKRMKENILSVAILVLDDLGSEVPTDQSLGIIFDIVEVRGASGLVTIITSNNSLRTLQKYWKRVQDDDVQQQSGRIIRRIKQRFRVFEVVGGGEDE